MAFGARVRNGNAQFFDKGTQQTTLPISPVVWEDHFLGKVIDTVQNWTLIDVSAVGDTTPVLVENEGGGIIQIMMDAQSEAQDSGFHQGDIEHFDLNAKLQFETRLSIETTIGSGVKFIAGVCGTYNVDKDAITEGAWFSAAASNAILVETDDTTNDENDETTGTTAVNGTFMVLRIDFSKIEDVRFFINGAAITTSTTFDMSNLTAAEAVMQPVIALDKASGSGLGTVYVDYVKLWSDETA